MTNTKNFSSVRRIWFDTCELLNHPQPVSNILFYTRPWLC